MEIPSWDEFFIRHCYLVATKSRDGNTKIGTVLVRDRVVCSEGYNGIPRRVNDNIKERNERPEKYYWYSHSERNSLYQAARNGIKTEECSLYTLSLPCSDCTMGIIQSGISEIIVHKQYQNIFKQIQKGKWEESCKRSKIMLQEAGIPIFEFDKVLKIKGFLDGREIEI